MNGSMQYNRRTVLVVDGDLVMLKLLNLALESWGYKTYQATDGEEALKVFHDRAPGLVIADRWIRKLDGLDLLRSVKEQNPRTAVILLSGHNTTYAATYAMQSGATDFLPKPIDYARLKSRVAASLNARN